MDFPMESRVQPKLLKKLTKQKNGVKNWIS